MMMNLSKGLFILSTTIVLTACNNAQIEGSWVEPVPGMPEMVQGFILENGGKASSINMATLQYEGWEKNGEKLILSGKSIGNHQTLSFTDTLIIKKLTQDSLILNKEGLVLRYFRASKK
ncbi:lipocalin family protein [Parabacteroides sp.]